MMKNALFISGPDWRLNANISNAGSYSNKWDAYAYGYKLAAETLAKRVIEELDFRDTLVYPIVYLYRHYLELRLKEIIEHGSNLIDEPYKIPVYHDLMIIWTEAKKVITKIWPNSSSQILKSIDKVMTEFVNIDKMSDAFRYPMNTSGHPTLQGITHINIGAFIAELTPIAEALEGMATGISVYEGYKEEMLSDYHTYLSSMM